MAERQDGERDGPHASLFPLFPTSGENDAPVATSSASSLQWLCNTSFTADLSLIENVTLGPPESPAIQEERGESVSFVSHQEDKLHRPYELIHEEGGSFSESERDTRNDKRRKKKKRKRNRHVQGESSLRVSGVYHSKPSKDYYLDARPDPDNLAYGSLYRMNIPSYKANKIGRSRDSDYQWYYIRNGNSFEFNRDSDADGLEEQAGGRYWSPRWVALERQRNFKRFRLVAPREPQLRLADEFIPLSEAQTFHASGGTSLLSKEQMVEESWEDEVLQKTREFNRMTREYPHSEKAWLAFAEFQDKVASKQTKKGARIQIIERKINILEKAVELNPENEELVLSLLKSYEKRDNAEVLINRWEKILMQHPGSYKLWKEFLHVLGAEFSRFKVSEMRKMYSHAIRALSSACSKQLRQVDTPSDPTFIQQELGLVTMFISLCRFEWQAGYQELATALLQAAIEYNIFCPSLLLTEQSKQRLFEHFWTSNAARVGEEGSLGWATWLGKEEENRHQLDEDECSENDDKGGWTGWSEPLAKDTEVSDMVKDNDNNVKDDDSNVVTHEDSDDEEADEVGVKKEYNADAMLELLGINIDAGTKDDFQDALTWLKWSEEEVSRDRKQWMPVHRNGSRSPNGDTAEGDGDEQILRAVLYEEVNEYLFSLRSTDARLALVYQFVDFFGGKISSWTCTNSPIWGEKIFSLEAFPDFLVETLKNIYDLLMRKHGGLGCASLEWLLSSAKDFHRGTEMMKFIRDAALLCLSTFPRNHVLEDAALVAEELFVSDMRLHGLSVSPCQTLAKRLLKKDRQDLLLCGVYARREATFGNILQARRIFDMALSSISGLPSNLQSSAPLLYLWYAEIEVSNSSTGFGPEKETINRALHILSCLGSGVMYSPFKTHVSSTQLVRANQGFRERIRSIQSTWVRGIIDDSSVAVVCSAALFEELESGFAAGLEILEHMQSVVLPDRKMQSLQLENLHNFYARMVRRHQEQLSPTKLWACITKGLQLYPSNPELLATLMETSHRYMSSKLRMVFDDNARKNPSNVVWLYALSYEISRGGSHHRIQRLFERALMNDILHHSVILWRCYILYEIEIANNPSSAKRIFFRAIHACPWSKRLWLDGFIKLNSVLTAKELSDLQEVMGDKELNLRTDIYEILLQDEGAL